MTLRLNFYTHGKVDVCIGYRAMIMPKIWGNLRVKVTVFPLKHVKVAGYTATLGRIMWSNLILRVILRNCRCRKGAPHLMF